jgi:uncharacterized membrane protein YtjA (UPF0391 family)
VRLIARPAEEISIASRHYRNKMLGRFKITQLFIMLYYTLIFLLIALLAGALGLFGIAGIAMTIARVLFVVFLVVFIVSLIQRGKR